MRFALLLLTSTSLLFPAVQRIVVKERGQAGAYESIRGTVYFAVDPANAANANIADLGLAPRNAKGEVEFSADLYMLKPRTANGTLLYEVSNRGGMSMQNLFNGNDSLLAEQGYTLVWMGWQFDLPADSKLLHISVPQAESVEGLVRSEFVPTKTTTRMPLGDRTMRPYLPLGESGAMSVRDAPTSPRISIPRQSWKFAAGGVVEMESGFQPGKFYDLVYRAKSSPIAGLGLAATRDLISYLKHGPDPLQPAIGFGVSQRGRFLRSFLFYGFNADEQGRQVFDGVWAHAAGAGRGSFNQRFAQPSRDGHRASNTSYPTDMFPFSDLPQGEGLLDRAREAHVTPKIFYTNGSYEYWGRAASLIHTTPDGAADFDPAPDTRIYFIAGTQHGRGHFPAHVGPGVYPTNAEDAAVVMRTLLMAMNAWITKGTEPPPSQYPRIDRKELVPFATFHFPVDVKLPIAPLEPAALDFGPDFRARGIASIEPPKAGKQYVALVPQVDSDGNEISGIRLPDVAVPLGVSTGWNLREDGELYSMVGSFFAFPRAKILKRYGSRAAFLKKTSKAIDDLTADRFLLPRDRDSLLRLAGERWDLLVQ